jgi:heavy metal translocating P-type ATPase
MASRESHAPARPAIAGGGRTERLVAVGVLLGLAGGGLAWALGRTDAAGLAWALTTGVAFVPLAWAAGRELVRRRIGVDAIALLAMAGALLLGEYLAGAVIAMMLSGGAWLESLADRRARRELARLVERQPRSVERYEGETLVTRPVAEIAPGDAFLVRPGEVVPVDGLVAGERAVLDTSALTGEALPAILEPGEKVDSGTVNAGGPMRVRATATAASSTYAGIVRLVAEAQATKAPMVRLADRYAAVFLPVTLAVAGAAWALSGDPVRALAVLVVATPCPLILATPIALMGGISRAARLGVVVKGGGALEVLARTGQLYLDKTGTVTRGRPVLVESHPFGALGRDELLRLAASLDLVSPHVLAAAIVSAARRLGLDLVFPQDAREEYGYGIAGRVDGRLVRLGQGDWVRGERPFPAGARAIRRRSMLEGLSVVFVEVDGKIAGALLLQDPLRPEAPRTIRRLRALGFRSVTLLTGDHLELARIVGNALGVDRVLAERSPVEKVEAVRQAAAEGPVVMVGDGINDAAALAVADVGIAMSARGASVSSETADAVVVADRFDRVADATRVARRSRRIALQSIGVGMALSGIGMGFAAAGYLAPVLGALVQEAIDVASILNALRALWGGAGERPAPPALARVRSEIHAEHEKLRPELEGLRRLADHLDALSGPEAGEGLRGALTFLQEDILAHHREEDERLYPELARVLGDGKSLVPLGRTHQEIEHLVRYFARILDETGREGPDAEDRRELRRLLYGLAAVLEVHFGEEETLVDAYEGGGRASP